MSSILRNKFIIFSVACIVSYLILLVPHIAYADLQSDLDEATAAAQAAQEALDQAVEEQNALQVQIDDLNVQITDKENQLPILKDRASKAVRDMYVSGGDILGILEAMLTGDDLSDVIASIEAYERISKWQGDQVSNMNAIKIQLETDRDNVAAAKAEQDQKVAEADAAHQEAIAAQGRAREALEAAKEAERQAYLAAQRKAAAVSTSSASGSRRASTSSSWSDEASAKAYIVGKESGGNYQARNGRYYGAYQLTESYLGGDYSPENQDRVAQNYVEGRYGSWVGAAQFWDSHGWY